MSTIFFQKIYRSIDNLQKTLKNAVFGLLHVTSSPLKLDFSAKDTSCHKLFMCKISHGDIHIAFNPQNSNPFLQYGLNAIWVKNP